MKPLGLPTNNNIFKYWGGKYKLAKWILDHFPSDYEELHYVEPFCGSSVLLLNKLPSKVETINDMDFGLFCLYRSIREKPKELTELLDNTLYSRNDLQNAINIINDDVKSYDFVTKGWAKYVILMASMFGAGSNTLMCGVGIENAQHSMTFRNAYRNKMDKVRNRLKHVNVLNKDAYKIVEQFDHPKALFYLDPPYPETNQSGYKAGYSMDDFNKLTERLKSTQGRYLISFEMKDGMECGRDLGDRHLFKKTIVRNSKAGINGDADGADAHECLMTNYRPECVRQRSLFD